MSKPNIIAEKSKAFAIRIINLYKYLKSEKNESALSEKLLQSGTNIGAKVTEAGRAPSKADFNAQMRLAMKEAGVTEYWLELLAETKFITPSQFESMQKDCVELIKILSAITRTSKELGNSA